MRRCWGREEDERGGDGVEEEDLYLLVTGFSLVPKDEFGLEPLRVVMDSNPR